MEGWVCPTCRRSLAPTVTECPHCAPFAKIAKSEPSVGAEGPFARGPVGETFTHGGARRD